MNPNSANSFTASRGELVELSVSPRWASAALPRSRALHLSYLIVVLGEGHEGPRLVCVPCYSSGGSGEHGCCGSLLQRSGVVVERGMCLLAMFFSCQKYRKALNSRSKLGDSEPKIAR